MIDRLPGTIITEISLYLNQIDLLSFMLTNKWLNEILTTRLYSKIVFDFDKIYKYKNKIGETVLTQLKSMNNLLTSSSTKKHLQSIKALKLNGYLVKNLSTSKSFFIFLKNFEKFMFGDCNRLISFINDSFIVDTSFVKNKEIEEMLHDVPICYLQEYKFLKLEKILFYQDHQSGPGTGPGCLVFPGTGTGTGTVGSSAIAIANTGTTPDLSHLSKISLKMLYDDDFEQLHDPLTNQIISRNLTNLFKDKISIDLTIDMKMLYFLQSHNITNISSRFLNLKIDDHLQHDPEILFKIFDFNNVHYLKIDCINTDDKNLLTNLLIGNDKTNKVKTNNVFKKISINSKIDNLNKL